MSAAFAVFAIAGAVFLISPPAAAADDTSSTAAEDPFAWLEQVDGDAGDGMGQGRERQDGFRAGEGSALPRTVQGRAGHREAKDRIPEPSIVGGQIFNFWQDADHVARNLATDDHLTNYRKRRPHGRPCSTSTRCRGEEKANWFWNGADCEEPAERAA